MSNRRTKYWIDLAVQGSIVRRILCHWLVFFTLCMLLLPIWRVVSGAEVIGPFSTLLMQAWVETGPAFVLMLLLLPLFVWDTVKLSNRFAGPMYRFRSALRHAAAGEHVAPVNFREGDFWKEVAKDLNIVLERLNAVESTRGGRPAADCKDTGSASCTTAAAGETSKKTPAQVG